MPLSQAIHWDVALDALELEGINELDYMRSESAVRKGIKVNDLIQISQPNQTI